VLRRLRSSVGLDDLEVWRDYYIEVSEGVSEHTIQRLSGILANPVVERCLYGAPLPPGAIQIMHRNGVVDNESDSIVQALCPRGGEKPRRQRSPQPTSPARPNSNRAIRSQLFNPNTDVLLTTEPALVTLRPQGRHTSAQRFDLRRLDPSALAELGMANGRHLSRAQMEHILHVQEVTGVPWVTDVLLEALDGPDGAIIAPTPRGGHTATS